MHIRTAQTDDAARLAGLLKQLGYARTSPDLARHITAAAADPQVVVLVAEVPGGSVAGCLQACITRRLAEGDGGEITSLVVDAECRGRGIGAALVRAAAEWLQTRAFERLRVRCNAKRKGAHQFYARLGFQPTKIQKVFDLQLSTNAATSLNPRAPATTMLDLPAYLARIEFDGDLRPDVGLLKALHQAHATRIPFENLDILLGRPIQVDLASIQKKLVHDRRGGYCFEHNLLMAAVLDQLGFTVRKLAARVRLGSDQVRARTHMLLMVPLDDQPLLVDVGFGAQGFQQPLPFAPGKVFRRFHWDYRIKTEDDAWVLQTRGNEAWIDLYAFTLEAQHWIDYKVANHYVSTHPDSQFARDLIVQRPTPEARYSLHNLALSIDRGVSTTTRVLRDQAELLGLLADIFDLHFPPETRFSV